MSTRNRHIKISKGRVIDPSGSLDKVCDIFISNGKIAAIGRAPSGFKASKTIEAKNQLVIPGLVDLAARMREPGEEHMATIDSESRAAASGGVTSLCCPPDTDPIVDTPAVAELIRNRARTAGRCKIYPVAALTHGLGGKSLSEMHALKSIGCVAVSNAYKPISDSEVLRRAMEYASNCNITVMLFCEDEHLRNSGTAHEGVVSMRLGLPGIPDTAETIAVSRAILLAEHSGASVHFCRLSSAKSVELVRRGKKNGLPLSADVSIQHLHLTDENILNFNSQCHVRPPLRTAKDRKALLKGVEDGTINAICSDHQPHNDDGKSLPFSLTESGTASLELLLPLTMKLIEDKQLSEAAALRAVTSGAASVLNLPAGRIAVNEYADICIVDPNKSWTIDRTAMISAGNNTPYDNWQMKARVSHCIMNGNIVYSN